MEVNPVLLSLFVFITCSSMIGTLGAKDKLPEDSHIADYDEYWHREEEKAMKTAIETYDSIPEKVTRHLNKHVHLALEASNNSTRRGLGDALPVGGGCSAANPIDQCWRCKPNWADRRQDLANCVLGFGRRTEGGKMGELYFVTDPSDDDLVNPKPGTLRYGVTRKAPLWIVFKTDMVIKLKQELIMASYKTIDGRGVTVHIAGGAGFMIQFAKHIIIHGIHIHDIVQCNGGLIRDSEDHFGKRSSSDGDAISIYGSSNIWIDHVTLSKGKDGLIDCIRASTGITISNSKFSDHDKVILLGAHENFPEDKIMQVTVAFNHFGSNLNQRMPRVRYGLAHVVNNDYNNWKIYALGGSNGGTIVSQGNRYFAPENKFLKQLTRRDKSAESVWVWTSDKDLLLNGAFFTVPGDKDLLNKIPPQDMIEASPGEAVVKLTENAGSLNCIVGQPC